MMRMRLWAGLATLAIAGTMTTAAFAQPGAGGRGRGGFGFGGGMGGAQSALMLAGNPAVQKELAVSEDQVAKLKTLGDEARAEMSEANGPMEDLRDLPEAERRAKMTELMAKRVETSRKINAKFKPKLAEVLDAKQVERLDQIALQAAGAQAYAEPDVVKALKLSKEQQEKIASINKDAAEKQRELFGGAGGGGGGDFQERFAKMAELNRTRDKDLAAVLTSEQSDQLAKMKGKEFDLAQLRGGPGGRPGGTGGRGRPDGQQGGNRQRPAQ